MRILILGSGGREHALGWALLQENPDAELLFCPGNGGTEGMRAKAAPGRPASATSAPSRNLAGDPSDAAAAVELARRERVDLTVVGPEAPLVAGVVDAFRKAGLPIFGPTARAAALEGSKVFAKVLMRECGVPTAAFEVFDSAPEAMAAAVRGEFPKVIKADGLAAGKGVLIVQDPEEARAAVRGIMEERRFGQAGAHLLIESFLQGEEVSAFALARDEEFRLLPLSQDHKRIGEGDTGPNTGGMGAYAPFPRGSRALDDIIGREVFAPVLRSMVERGAPFRGLLYAGLILVAGKPVVLEFNCRFGDPETQAVLPLLAGGFTEALLAVATGEGPLPEVQAHPGSAATVVLASGGYPGSYRGGYPIEGLEEASGLAETFVFHAGTRREGERTVTAGGRVLAVTGRGSDLREALDRAYEGCARIEFEGKTLRRDIGRRGLEGASAPGGVQGKRR